MPFIEERERFIEIVDDFLRETSGQGSSTSAMTDRKGGSS
jgi:hypothetical protein